MAYRFAINSRKFDDFGRKNGGSAVVKTSFFQFFTLFSANINLYGIKYYCKLYWKRVLKYLEICFHTWKYAKMFSFRNSIVNIYVYLLLLLLLFCLLVEFYYCCEFLCSVFLSFVCVNHTPSHTRCHFVYAGFDDVWCTLDTDPSQ